MATDDFSPESMADAFANWMAEEDLMTDPDNVRLMARAFQAGCSYGIRHAP